MNAYQGVWAYNWIQLIAHHYRKTIIVFSGVTLLILLGLLQQPISLSVQDLLAVTASLLAMALLAIKLLDSFKVGVLILGLVSWQLLSLFGLLGWLEIPWDAQSVLGLVMVETLMISNLVHLLTTMFREMARGAFQHDALPEAIKLTIAPIFLSNLTTALGVGFAAMAAEEYSGLAWVVALGALLSFIMILSLFPLLLLKWFMEFRVGNFEDRHGLLVWIDWLQGHPKIRSIMVFSTLVVWSIAGGWLFGLMVDLQAVASMLLVTFLVLWLFWKSLVISLLHLLASVGALVLILAVYQLVFAEEHLVVLLFLLPLGIILDDGIHFFSRFLKAKQGFFRDDLSAIRFAMSSVGRAIWVTTWLLMTGFFILAVFSNSLIQLASLLVVVAAWVATYMTLLVVPALYLSREKR